MEKIKELRLQKGLSQRALASKAGISQSMLSDIEKGKVNPTVKVLIKISNALGVDITELVENIAS
ncbi:helix-turn-helix transcriptional regulator [Caloramator sp. CAR-1]|uniref:helix-turn-helix domain-containing protein n=1 Tax=Caloramator sp. CAR-1 TaxID=3062777 RepID=UPI0026E18BB0|nr:helix-turn-helix transcriptional regulator [Caloramator sp. CAR-1]MDO6353975.1 helix-turn-helix transcriptional regulator [Caloramator sp. CAR-1]